MPYEALPAVPGAHVLAPERHGDARGEVLEWFRADRLAELLGRPVPVLQANLSVSGRGVLRGLHVSDVPPGQGKVVTCLAGSVLDVLVDLRVGSPSFGAHERVVLDDVERRAVWVPEGVGHAFLVTGGHTTVAYLCTTTYAPARERVLLATSVGVDWGVADGDLVLSERDAAAPTLAEAVEAGWLPRYADCLAL